MLRCITAGVITFAYAARNDGGMAVADKSEARVRAYYFEPLLSDFRKASDRNRGKP